jgi:hypothetical protein
MGCIVRKLATSIAAFLISGVGAASAAQLSVLEVTAIAHAAGFECGEPLQLAVAVAVSESSLNPYAKNMHPEYGMQEGGNLHIDRGLWQISTYWWPAYSDDKAFSPAGAAEAAFEVSQGGKDFTPWDSYDSGAAQRHLDVAYDGWPALRPIIEAYCG